MQGRLATAARNARAIRGDLKALATEAGLAENADVARLQRRILRHLRELVTFVTSPALEGQGFGGAARVETVGEEESDRGGDEE